METIDPTVGLAGIPVSIDGVNPRLFMSLPRRATPSADGRSRRSRCLNCHSKELATGREGLSPTLRESCTDARAPGTIVDVLVAVTWREIVLAATGVPLNGISAYSVAAPPPMHTDAFSAAVRT